jgi:hypothetical protein
VTVRELVTTWGFDIDTKPLEQMEKHVGGLKETILHLSELLIGEGASFFGLAETTAEAGVNFKKTAEEVGTTTTRFQELTYAAKQWDVQEGALTSGLRRLSMMAVQAARGSSEAGRTLTQAGVDSLYDGSGKMLRSDQLMAQIAKKFKAMPTDAMKAGLAVQIFGRSGSQLMPILNRWGTELDRVTEEGRKLGVVMDESAIAKSEIFKESMNRLHAMVTGLRNTIGVALMPAIEDMIKSIQNWYLANEDVIRTDIARFAKQFSDAALGGFHAVVGLANGTLWLTDKLGGLGMVMKIVTAGFLAWTAMGVVSEISEIIKIVILATKAVWAFAAGEAAMTGGLSAVASIAGAAAVGGAAMYMMRDQGIAASGTLPKSVSNGAASDYINAGGAGTVNNFHLNLPPGTPAQHAGEVFDLVKSLQTSHSRSLSAASEGGRKD